MCDGKAEVFSGDLIKIIFFEVFLFGNTGFVIITNVQFVL